MWEFESFADILMLEVCILLSLKLNQEHSSSSETFDYCDDEIRVESLHTSGCYIPMYLKSEKGNTKYLYGDMNCRFVLIISLFQNNNSFGHWETINYNGNDLSYVNW